MIGYSSTVTASHSSATVTADHFSATSTPAHFSTTAAATKRNRSRGLIDESGSLSVLIIALFLIVLIFSLNLVNISDVFAAKRELINVGEMAISQAAHSLALDRYYSGDRTADDAAGDGQVFRVPIDCNQASTIFDATIAASNLRGSAIQVSMWTCANDEISATLVSSIASVIRLPLNINTSQEEVSTSLSATSILGGSR